MDTHTAINALSIRKRLDTISAHTLRQRTAMDDGDACVNARHALNKLLRLHARINTDSESIAIAGPDYEEHHTVCFDAHGSIAEQQQDI